MARYEKKKNYIERVGLVAKYNDINYFIKYLKKKKFGHSRLKIDSLPGPIRS